MMNTTMAAPKSGMSLSAMFVKPTTGSPSTPTASAKEASTTAPKGYHPSMDGITATTVHGIVGLPQIGTKTTGYNGPAANMVTTPSEVAKAAGYGSSVSVTLRAFLVALFGLIGFKLNFKKVSRQLKANEDSLDSHMTVDAILAILGFQPNESITLSAFKTRLYNWVGIPINGQVYGLEKLAKALVTAAGSYALKANEILLGSATKDFSGNVTGFKGGVFRVEGQYLTFVRDVDTVPQYLDIIQIDANSPVAKTIERAFNQGRIPLPELNIDWNQVNWNGDKYGNFGRKIAIVKQLVLANGGNHADLERVTAAEAAFNKAIGIINQLVEEQREYRATRSTDDVPPHAHARS